MSADQRFDVPRGNGFGFQIHDPLMRQGGAGLAEAYAAEDATEVGKSDTGTSYSDD